MPKDNRPWIRVSVDMWRHPKIMTLTAAQFRTLIALWSLSMEYRTDGELDVKFVRTQGLTSGAIRALTTAGLATMSDDEQTLYLHDYLEHQQSAARLEEATKQRRSAGRKGGQAKARNRSESPSGSLSESLTGSLSEIGSDLRANAREVEEEGEGENNTSSAAADTYVTRGGSEQRPISTTFGDGTPIPPEPPHDGPPSTRGALALVPDVEPPARIEGAARPTRDAEPTAAAATIVRLHVPAGIPRTVRRQLAIEVDRLRRDHTVDRRDVETGLAVWGRRSGAGPKLLPNLVADAARARVAPPTTGAATAKAQGWLDLIDELPPDDTPKELR